jgi:hypothetical protein
MYFNMYVVFDSQYSLYVSEQGIRNVEKEVLYAMA